MQKGFYAFYCETGGCYNLISKTFEDSEKCHLQELEYVQFLDPYYAMQKNSTLREFVRVGLVKLAETGLNDRQASRVYEKKPTCAGGGGKFISVGIVDVQPALLLLCWGIGIAMTIFALEFLMRRFNVIEKCGKKFGRTDLDQ